MNRMIQYLRMGLEEVMIASTLAACQTASPKPDVSLPVQEEFLQPGISRFQDENQPSNQGYKIVACAKGVDDNARRVASEKARESFRNYTTILSLDEESQDFRYPNFELRGSKSGKYQGWSCAELIALHHPPLRESTPKVATMDRNEIKRRELDYRMLGHLLDKYDVQ